LERDPDHRAHDLVVVFGSLLTYEMAALDRPGNTFGGVQFDPRATEAAELANRSGLREATVNR
jgi:hypothetical protein